MGSKKTNLIKILTVFIGGVLVGILLTLGYSNLLRHTEPATKTWNSDAIYIGGDEVAYEGRVYRAKWWTQGEKPGSADVWEDMLTAAGESISWTEETKQEKSSTSKPKDNSETAKKYDDFKVVGYFPSWKEDTDRIQYDILTHINYAFAIPTEKGTLRPLENAETAHQIIKEAHEKDVKVFLAVGGWSYNEIPLEATFVSATDTKEKTAFLADSILKMCDEYGFDGVDLDWEHPRVDGDTCLQYENLVLELAKRLHEQGKQLSCAVVSGVTADGNIYYDAAAHTDTVLKTVDWINVMAYDGGDGERHSSYDFAVNCGTYWSETRGLSASKVILGMPFYARPGWASYADITAQVPNAWENDHVDYNGMEVWYNGVSTIKEKTSYALDNLGGVMIWEISQDTTDEHSLQKIIGKVVNEVR